LSTSSKVTIFIVKVSSYLKSLKNSSELGYEVSSVIVKTPLQS